MAMNRKLKLALAALMGFSAACSTVKNAPSTGSVDAEAASDTVSVARPIIVMYGVRPPAAKTNYSPLDSALQQDSTTTTATTPDSQSTEE